MTPPPENKLRPLSPKFLGGLAVVCAGIGWVVFQLFERLETPVPTIGWYTPAGWGLFAIVLGVMARVMHLRIQVRRVRVEPQVAVACLALGRASAVLGAMFLGFYGVWALLFSFDLGLGARKEPFWACAISALLAVLVAVTGLLLERACKVPEDPDEDNAAA